jgi:hypothetical protein
MKTKFRYALVLGLLFAVQISAQQRYTREMYIETFAPIAIREMHAHGIPASITLSQAILESGDGNSELARKANNHFGIKCGGSWDGPSVRHDDDARNECFRKYRNAETSFTDHSLFLVNGKRYEDLFSLDRMDYKRWAKGLQKAGYATNPSYATRLIDLIERHQLHAYDRMDAPKGSSNDAELVYPETPNGVPYFTVEEGMDWVDVSKATDIPIKRLLRRNEVRMDQPLKELDRVYLKSMKCRAKQKIQVVQQGESMFSIAHLHALKLERLYALNRMNPGEQPRVGDRLRLRWKSKKR